MFVVFFFFKQKTAYDMRISYWSSDVCSSDLTTRFAQVPPECSFVAHRKFRRAPVAWLGTLSRNASASHSVENCGCRDTRRADAQPARSPVHRAPESCLRQPDLRQARREPRHNSRAAPKEIGRAHV